MKAAAVLQQALLASRLAHAYLLTGGDPATRLQLAEKVAAALNCIAPQEGRPCGNCRSCRQVALGNHPDVHYLRPEGKSIKIEQVRQLEARLSLEACQGGAKVVIVTAAEDFTTEAANCLLKTLEEPPEDTYFFLLAARGEQLLPTIRSRCQELAMEEAGTIGAAGAAYWQRICMADLLALFQEILPEMEQEEDLEGVLAGLAIACRDSLVWQLTGEEKLLFTAQIKEINAWDLPALVRCYRAITKARRALQKNANRRLTLEVLLLDLQAQLRKGLHLGG
ncbi:MAG: polymerase subunit delta [Clostridia bacterium]|nr:polymerase subunit delta [Clostridia bacterium]